MLASFKRSYLPSHLISNGKRCNTNIIEVCKSLHNQGLENLEETYVHPYWAGTKAEIKNFIEGAPEKNFLTIGILATTWFADKWAPLKHMKYATLNIALASKQKINLHFLKKVISGNLI